MHYALLICIILLQLIAIIIWYNETANEGKVSDALKSIKKADTISRFTDKINSRIIQSQEHFNNYINTKEKTSLDAYLDAVKDTGSFLDSLHFASKDNTEFKNLLDKKEKTSKEILQIKSAIDSILDNQIYPHSKDVSAPFAFDRFDYNKILDSIKTNTFIKVDSVSRKGLLGRLIAAFSGKIEIQKEQLNTIVTMKYKDKVKTGTIEEQMKNVFQTTNKYYENEFKKLKAAFLNLRAKDIELIKFNTQLLALSQNALPDFTAAAGKLKTDGEEKLKNQIATNKSIRNYTIVILIVLMFIISLLLFGFTRLSFEYEKRLTVAQKKIRNSLNFKNRIMGMISHEIRSPLNIISIYSKKIGKTIKEPELQETFKSIEFTTNSLQMLSGQILEYSRDENHKQELKPKNFFLKTELEQVVKSLQSLVESKGNTLNVKSAIKTDYEVYADAAKIHQLFYNIVGNANKFTEKGYITIDIKEDHSSEFETNLMVTIKDSGSGIHEEDLKHIFESYYQGTVSEKVTNLGIGLGLNLCKEIIALFEGEITVESEYGKGTKVAFNIILSKV